MGIGFVMVLVIVAGVILLAGALDGRQIFTDLHDFRFVAEDTPEGTEIALHAHAGGEIQRRVASLLKIRLDGLEMMRIAVFPDQIDNFHPISSHLAGQIPDQGVERCDFQLGGFDRKEERNEENRQRQAHEGKGAKLR